MLLQLKMKRETNLRRDTDLSTRATISMLPPRIEILKIVSARMNGRKDGSESDLPDNPSHPEEWAWALTVAMLLPVSQPIRWRIVASLLARS